MGQNDVTGLAIETFAEKTAGSFVGQMPFPAHDTLFQGPRIRPYLKHFQIVIRFQHNHVASFQLLYDEFGHVSEVCDMSDFEAFRLKRESQRIHSVMRNRERGNLEVLELEGFAGRNEFQRTALDVRIDSCEGLVADIDRQRTFAKQTCNTTNVVGMLVRDNQSVNVVQRLTDGTETLECLGRIQSCIQQNLCLGGRNEGAVSRAAAT